MFLPLLPCPFGFEQCLLAQAAKQLHHVLEVKSRRYLAETLGQPCLSSFTARLAGASPSSQNADSSSEVGTKSLPKYGRHLATGKTSRLSSHLPSD